MGFNTTKMTEAIKNKLNEAGITLTPTQTKDGITCKVTLPKAPGRAGVYWIEPKTFKSINEMYESVLKSCSDIIKELKTEK